LHAVLQQMPSTQKPELHSCAALHAPPSAFFDAQPPAAQ
jgi:hypothetical protein